jgi:hypothetical protein
MIIISLFFNLAGAKVNNVKIFQIEALDLSVFMAMILVGCFRNVLNKSYTKLTYGLTCFITLLTMSLCVYLASLSSSKLKRVYNQFYYIVTTYDSIISIINCVIFCLCISLFLEQIKITFFAEPNRFAKSAESEKE